MSKIDALGKQVRRMAEQAAPPPEPDYILGGELQQEFNAFFAYLMELEEDTTLTEQERAARLQEYKQEREAGKTPERREQERRFHRKYARHAAAAKESLLRKLEAEIEREEQEDEQSEWDAARN